MSSTQPDLDELLVWLEGVLATSQDYNPHRVRSQSWWSGFCQAWRTYNKATLARVHQIGRSNSKVKLVRVRL